MSKSPTSADPRQRISLFANLVDYVRLSWRLLGDQRVPGWVKAIPVLAVLYFLSPIDLIPDWALPGLGELDDIAVLLLALKMFVDLSPDGVVREHLNDLMGRIGSGRQARPSDDASTPAVIDASYHVLDDEK